MHINYFCVVLRGSREPFKTTPKKHIGSIPIGFLFALAREDPITSGVQSVFMKSLVSVWLLRSSCLTESLPAPDGCQQREHRASLPRIAVKKETKQLQQQPQRRSRPIGLSSVGQTEYDTGTFLWQEWNENPYSSNLFVGLVCVCDFLSS